MNLFVFVHIKFEMFEFVWEGIVWRMTPLVKGVNELSEFEQFERTRTSDSFGIAQKNSNPWNSREKFESWEIVVKI